MSLACLDFAVTRMYSSTAVSEKVVQKKRKMYTTVFKGMMGSIGFPDCEFHGRMHNKTTYWSSDISCLSILPKYQGILTQRCIVQLVSCAE